MVEQKLRMSLVLAIAITSLPALAGGGQGEEPLAESTEQLDDGKLVFSSLDVDQTNRGTVNINGYDRHFSVTFPTSYDSEEAYPVVLFFHGCMCRPTVTDERVLSYLDWSPRLEPYRDDFIVVRMSAFSEGKQIGRAHV